MIDNTVVGVLSTSPVGITVLGAGIEVRGNRIRGLARNGDDGLAGIEVLGTDVTVDRNRVSMVPDAELGSVGIHANINESTFCSNNTAAGFFHAWAWCQDAGGNAYH